MSDENITYKEDRDNLLYIFKKLKKLEHYKLVGDDGQTRDSSSSSEEEPAASLQSELTVRNIDYKQPGPDVFRDPEILAKTKPFDFDWSYSIESKTGLINLTTEERKELLFVSSHFPILYNFSTKKMKCLEGHQHLISSISTDESGRWLVTADIYKDGYVIIWDKDELKPVHILFGIYSRSGTLLIQISRNAKYLITIGVKIEGYYSIDLWEWTYGHENPNDSYKVSITQCGAPIEICFNPNVEEFIMVIFKKGVFFLTWDEKQSKFGEVTNPPIPHKHVPGTLTTGTYLRNCHESYVCTSNGLVLIFDNTICARPFKEGGITNSKIFIQAVKVSDDAIKTCVATYSSLVIGDESGAILFFDKNMRILYWLRNYDLGAIDSISFNLSPGILDKNPTEVYFTETVSDSQSSDSNFSDITWELEEIFNKEPPEDLNLIKDPYLAHEFFVGTADGNIYAINFQTNKCVPIHMMNQVSAIEIHDELPYLLIGFESGRIELIDYETNKLVCFTSLRPYSDDRTSITSLKYSPESLHLVCGRVNGEIWILEPTLLTPKNNVPIHATNNIIQKVVFSKKILQFAYFDDKMIVVLCQYDKNDYKWKVIGKIISHYEPVNDIIFMTVNRMCILYTIACDRLLIGYNNLTTDKDRFGIATKNRIEQRAIPLAMIQWNEERGGTEMEFFLIADNEHKFKLLKATNKVPVAVILAPAFGCFKNHLISKMMVLPKGRTVESTYMVFISSKFLGLHIAPPDGNPYKYTGYMAHSSKVTDFCVSMDGSFVFTLGEDNSVFKWRTKTKAVDLMHVLGGKELEPYYCLIEGGKNGWLFQEIKDLFYYIQILEDGDNVSYPRQIGDSIKIEDLPDLLRTCGFYPSEFELENLMIDIQFRNFHETAMLNTEINFVDFVKLFCNYKPVYGYFKEKIKKAFETIIYHSRSFSEKQISREKFCSILSSSGEHIDAEALREIMKILLRSDDHTEENFDFLPEKISFEILIDDIFGIDMGKAKVEMNRPVNEKQDTENFKYE